ncbi:unnamed protein product [Caenorhabditis sp. 36 PRJEB53466]|nr:unnamed protein product [Caenorhabditis sp. 36 PRJEB53466]
MLRAPAAESNKDVILEVLRRFATPGKKVFEVASGTGQHVVYFAQAIPEAIFQPTEVDGRSLHSIVAHVDQYRLDNVRIPLYIDVAKKFDQWALPADFGPNMVDIVLNINMLHICSTAAVEGLFESADQLLHETSGVLITYGRYSEDGFISPQSNVAFHAMLRNQDAEHGLKDIKYLERLAIRHKLRLAEKIPSKMSSYCGEDEQLMNRWQYETIMIVFSIACTSGVIISSFALRNILHRYWHTNIKGLLIAHFSNSLVLASICTLDFTGYLLRRHFYTNACDVLLSTGECIIVRLPYLTCYIFNSTNHVAISIERLIATKWATTYEKCKSCLAISLLLAQIPFVFGAVCFILLAEDPTELVIHCLTLSSTKIGDRLYLVYYCQIFSEVLVVILQTWVYILNKRFSQKVVPLSGKYTMRESMRVLGYTRLSTTCNAFLIATYCVLASVLRIVSLSTNNYDYQLYTFYIFMSSTCQDERDLAYHPAFQVMTLLCLGSCLASYIFMAVFFKKYAFRVFWHLNIKILFYFNMLISFFLATSVIVNFSGMWHRILTATTNCEVVVQLEECQLIRWVFLVSFCLITLNHTAIVIERLWATVRLSKYEKSSGALGILLVAIITALSLLIVHLIMIPEDSTEYVPTCLSLSASKIGENIYYLFTFQCFTEVLVLSAHKTLLWFNRKRFSTPPLSV